MSYYFEHNVTIDSRDVDGRGICKASALLGHLQEAATLAAEAGHFGRGVLSERYGAIWMLARSWYGLKRPLRWGENMAIRTWHRGRRGAMLYRDYDILVDGEWVGESVSAWVLADRETHSLLRLHQIDELREGEGGELCKTMLLSKLRCPKDLAEVERRTMRYSDTDINGHVNNTRYADFACDLLDMDGIETQGRFLAQLRLGFLAECRPGEQIILQVGPGEDGGSYVRGLDESGKSRFEAALFFGEALP
ncbi:MAG: acyl-ACP thioesterase [Clostridium sp.]|nr:acyl-ACP thioesterase [Clostridium sp.]